MKKYLIVALAAACLSPVFLAAPAVAQTAAALPDFTVLVEKNSPAVVNISASRKVDNEMPEVPEDHPLNEMFRRFFDERRFPWHDAESMGSGFIVSADGYIVTNAHVVEDVDEITVTLYDRREWEAEVVGIDERSDIALLRIGAGGLPTVTLGNSQDLKVGEWVMAIGNPFGFGHTVTAGIVSAKGRNFSDENYVPFIQTDVAINPGNSGGPLFNTAGEVVGVNSRISSEPGRRSYAGLSFAIPAEVVADVIGQLKEKGRVSRGWLGVLIQDVSPELAQPFGLEKPAGALVAQVLNDSPAEAGGIEVGDVIIEFEGAALKASSDLPPLVGRVSAGKFAKVKVMRDGEERLLNVRIGELPESGDALSRRRPADTQREETNAEKLGLRLEELSDDIKEETGADRGVFIAAVDDGPAREVGFRAGDVILAIRSEDMTDVDEVNDALGRLPPGSSVAVLVQRDSAPMFLAMRVPQTR